MPPWHTLAPVEEQRQAILRRTADPPVHAAEYCRSAFTRTEGYHIAHENTRTFLVET